MAVPVNDHRVTSSLYGTRATAGFTVLLRLPVHVARHVAYPAWVWVR